jgi:hypothetical protein
MLIRVWRLLAIMLTALSMGAALAHLLEMPAKLGYSGALWLTLLQTLYPPAFGTVGAFFIVDAADLDEAVDAAAKHPGAHVGQFLGGGIEVRPCDMFEQC